MAGAKSPFKVDNPDADARKIERQESQDLGAMSRTIGKGIKKPRSKRQVAKLAILRRQRGMGR